MVALMPPEVKPFLDLLNIAAKKGIYPVFSAAAEGEAASLEQRQEEVSRRLDLRQEEMITVDGEDSQDLDDGFSLSCQADGSWPAFTSPTWSLSPRGSWTGGLPAGLAYT